MVHLQSLYVYYRVSLSTVQRQITRVQGKADHLKKLRSLVSSMAVSSFWASTGRLLK